MDEKYVVRLTSRFSFQNILNSYLDSIGTSSMWNIFFLSHEMKIDETKITVQRNLLQISHFSSNNNELISQ